MENVEQNIEQNIEPDIAGQALAAAAGEVAGIEAGMRRQQIAENQQQQRNPEQRARSRSRERRRSSLRLTIFSSAELCGAMYVADRMTTMFHNEVRRVGIERNLLRRELMNGAHRPDTILRLWDDVMTTNQQVQTMAGMVNAAWDAVTDLHV